MRNTRLLAGTLLGGTLGVGKSTSQWDFIRTVDELSHHLLDSLTVLADPLVVLSYTVPDAEGV